MDGKVVRKLREDHKRILSERYSGVDISLKELGFVCISLICGRFGGLTRSYLAYVWQSHPENGSARKIAHFGSWPSMAR